MSNNNRNNNTARYGLFYRSHGEWTDPYFNKTMTLENAQTFRNQAKKLLKSRVLIRKVV